MTGSLTSNTQAILLLTAPLIAGRSGASADLLSPGEYNRLAKALKELQRQPADLLGQETEGILEDCRQVVDKKRVRQLLDRGFLLSQAVDNWHARSIWVISRADPVYPKRLKSRLKEDSPAILYGCGEPVLLEQGGLAVVGSRHVDDALLEYTEGIGRLAADARMTLISGGARGIDQASMRGASQAGGTVVGVLSDSLLHAALAREHREGLLDGRLVFVSPYDPAAGFNVGHAMQRNKLIYGLAEAALVVSSDFKKGGTWTGAVEQLDKFKFCPVFVRTGRESGKGNEALIRKGALPWPDPKDAVALEAAIEAGGKSSSHEVWQEDLPLMIGEPRKDTYQASNSDAEVPSTSLPGKAPVELDGEPARLLFTTVRNLLIEGLGNPASLEEVARSLDVSKAQAKVWLTKLVESKDLEKFGRPARFRVPRQ